jgi:hypothetical protein
MVLVKWTLTKRPDVRLQSLLKPCTTTFEIDFAMHHTLSHGIFPHCYFYDQNSALEFLLQLYMATILARRSPNAVA